MNFRHFSGVDAESLAQAHRFIEWSDAVGMPLRKMCSAMRYLDVRTMSVRADAVAKLKWRPWRAVGCISYACIVLAGGVALSQSGVFRVAATGTYFAVTASTIAVWSDGPWPQIGNHAHCVVSAQPPIWVKLDRDAICELITSKAFTATLQEAIRNQRGLALMLIAFWGWIFIVSAKELKANRVAQEILDRSGAIEKTEVTDTNPSISLGQPLGKVSSRQIQLDGNLI